MEENEDITKHVDLIYKNLLDKFNPSARHLISAGKTYLKSLHTAMSSSRSYLEALTQLAYQSQASQMGGSSDVGMCLGEMVDVYKEVQAQQMNILKAFYVDLLLPLENNLDRDTKILQAEQKKFLTTQKQRFESYNKACNAVRKQKKKGRSNKQSTMDKEIKQFQTLDDEKMKLDNFLSLSLKDASKQERRRYGFILERHSSLAKHYQAHHTKGASLLQQHVHNWTSVAKTREELPVSIHYKNNEQIYNCPNEKSEYDNDLSEATIYRRARSVEGSSCTDLRTTHFPSTTTSLSRTRSEYHIGNNHQLSYDNVSQHSRLDLNSRSCTPCPSIRNLGNIQEDNQQKYVGRALYPYHPSADDQLEIIENDTILMIGQTNKGWQFGENQRTRRLGWYPMAYTEMVNEEEEDSALSYSQSSSRGRYESFKDSSKSSNSRNSRAKSAEILHRTNSNPITKFRNTSWSTTSPSSTSSAVTKTLQHAKSSSSTKTTKITDVTLPRRSFSSPRDCLYKPSHCHNNSFSSGSSSLSPPEECNCTHSSKTTSSSSTITCLNCSFSSHERSAPRLNMLIREVSFNSSDDSGYSHNEIHKKEQEFKRFPKNESKLVWNDSFVGVQPKNFNKSQIFTEHDPLEYSSTSPNFNPINKMDSNIDDDPLNLSNKKKGTPVSPCAQKIAAQREKNKFKKKDKRLLKRSSSLLCIDISSCRGVPKELLMADYEDVWSGEWQHTSLVDIRMDIPAPPSFEPPNPPSSKGPSNYSTRPPMPLPHEMEDIINSKDLSKENKPLSSSSSGHSTLEGSWSSGDDVYMVVPENTKEETKKTIRKSTLRKHVVRSLTWASPDKKQRSKPIINRSKISQINSKCTPEPPPRPAKPKLSCSFKGNQDNQESPPLPPRKYPHNMRHDSIMNGVNIFNYSEFLNRRLKLPEGNSRLDQRSCTSGNICGPWYDMWGDDQVPNGV